MKPRLFLSHSSVDKALIYRLEGDLKSARVDCWVDEWEIPVGTSFRRQIFEEGLPACDVFFIYLTPAAIKSYWVSTELDAAFMRDAESRGGYLITYVDCDATRAKLSLDLQLRYSPVLSEENYVRAVAQIAARAWEISSNRQLDDLRQKRELESQAARGRAIELENEIRRLGLAQPDGVETALAALKTITYDVALGALSLQGILRSLHILVAGGMSQDKLALCLYELTQIHFGNNASMSMSDAAAVRMIGDLNLLGMIDVTLHREPASEAMRSGPRPAGYYVPENKDVRSFVLTELGRRVINSLLTT